MDPRASFRAFLAGRLKANQHEHQRPGLTVADRHEIKGFARGLSAADLLGPAEVDALLAEMDAHPLVEGAHYAAAAQSLTVSADARREAVLLAQTANVGEPLDHHLLRVVPLSGRYSSDPEVPTLLSLELWSSMLSVRTAYSQSRRSFSGIVNDDHLWHATDELGSKYQQCGRADSDFRGMVISTRYFEPGPPPEARQLHLSVRSAAHPDLDLHLPLR